LLLRRFFHNNGLSLVVLGLFVITFAGQYVTGYLEFNEEQRQHNQAQVSPTEYLGEGHFIEATFENWESEFLQMGAYVLLTIWLYQKGSSESKTPGTIERVDFIAEQSRTDSRSPYPVRKGGWLLKLYENSLSLALLLLFALSFALHAYGGAQEYNEGQQTHGAAQVSTIGYIGTSRFWFESFQNWQSEFLSIFAMVFLSVYLRQKGSPESKPVDSPHDETGVA
jgi:hypothetical protein